MNDRRTIAVDLTPLLPGATNGGAKILVLALLRQLAKLAPETNFVLLTRKSSHDELEEFERANMTRKLLWNDIEEPGQRGNRFSIEPAQLEATVIRAMPPQLKQLSYDFRRLLTASAASGDDSFVPTLLFSPFGLSESYGGMELSPTDLPTVAILYDLQHRRYPQFFSAAEVAKRERNLHLYSKAGAVLAAISDFVRTSAVETGLIADDLVSTVYIRLPNTIANTDAHDAGRGLGLKAGSYLLYPANFWPHKNHQALLEAFSIARGDALPPALKLVCTGAPGDHATEVAKAASARGLSEAIIFPGFLDKAQFAAVLRSARGVVFPSLYEGFGMPVIEAMAAGCPVACSNSTSLREVAGNAALLFDPDKPADIAQAILRLVGDEALRTVLIAKGFSQAATFADTERMTREYLRLFDYAIDRWQHRDVPTDSTLHGVYDDGWASPLLLVRYGRAPTNRTIRIELQVPGWLPVRSYELSIETAGASRPARQWLKRGNTSVIEVPIGPDAGQCRVHIKPFFRPIELNNATDTRKLTLMVQRIDIRGRETIVTMFPRAGGA